MNFNRIIAVCIICFFSLSTAIAAPSNDDEYSAKKQSGPYSFAVAAINQQDYSKAINYLDEVIKEQPKNADAYNLLGFSHRKMKNYETAERYYNKALALEPKHRGALEYLGELYVETQRMADARTQLAKLDKACWFGCEEYDLLKAKITAAESN